MRELEVESRVRDALRWFEEHLRELALVALADWSATGTVRPELFAAIVNVRRPAFGTWNGILQALRHARRAALRDASGEVRDRLLAARDLETILRVVFDEAIPTSPGPISSPRSRAARPGASRARGSSR